MAEKSGETVHMGDKYSVSIVMPTYNKRDIAAENVRRLLEEQTYDKSLYEVVVVDDGSTDDTVAHLKKRFSDEIKAGRLQVHTQKNQGVTTARNTGIKHARGNYIARMDDDDPPLANRLEDSVNYFKKNPDRRIVHAKSYWVDPQGKMLHNGKNFQHGLCRSRENLAKEHDLQNRTEEMLLKDEDGQPAVHRNVVHGGTTLAHRTLYKEIQEIYGHVYDPHISNSEDKDLWVRIAKHARDKGKKEFGFMDKIVANYTYTEDTAKKEALKQRRISHINGYINSKMRKPKQHRRVIFSKDPRKDKTLHSLLHKRGQDAYKQGERVTYVFRDPKSSKYTVRRLDTDVITKSEGKFFKGKILEYGSLEDLMAEHDIHKADEVDFIDASHFRTEQRKLYQKTPTNVVSKAHPPSGARAAQGRTGKDMPPAKTAQRRKTTNRRRPPLDPTKMTPPPGSHRAGARYIR